METEKTDIEKALEFLNDFSFVTPGVNSPEISKIIDNFVSEFIKSVEAAKLRLLEIK